VRISRKIYVDRTVRIYCPSRSFLNLCEKSAVSYCIENYLVGRQLDRGGGEYVLNGRTIEADVMYEGSVKISFSSIPPRTG
jgi:hypothetical protein